MELPGERRENWMELILNPSKGPFNVSPISVAEWRVVLADAKRIRSFEKLSSRSLDSGGKAVVPLAGDSWGKAA
jgi:hypothetical protein